MSKVKILTRLTTFEEAGSSIAEEIFRRIIEVYDQSEGDLMKTLGQRTTLANVRALMQAQQLLVAEVDREIVGSVVLFPVNASTIEFGMLVSDTSMRKQGIGLALVRAAENAGYSRGFATIQLQVLAPQHYKHPHKEFLKDWYARLGYQLAAVQSPECCHPGLNELLAVDCEVSLWKKALGPQDT